MGAAKTNYNDLEITVREIMSDFNIESVTQATKEACSAHNIEYNETMGRTMRHRINGKGSSLIEHTKEFIEAKNKVHSTDKKRFIVTWAQNDTAVHAGFLNNIEKYANHIDAEIIVILGRYKNPSLYIKPERSTWDDSILKYSCASRIKLHDYLQVLGDIKTQPTAINPLSGMNSITGMESTIIGHPKIALESLPVLRGHHNKLVLSTGAVTTENYSDSAAGKKGEFHHSLGFAIVEIDGSNFHVRQVSSSNDGSFYDLDYFTKDGVVSKDSKCVRALVAGDIHAGEHDEIAISKTIDMLHRFNPDHVILHDIMSGISVNHHERNNPFIQMEKEVNGTISIETEVSSVIKMVRRFLKWNPVVVASNHNFFIDRWLHDIDWRKHPNKKSYIKYASLVSEGVCEKGIIAYELDREFGDKVTCLDYYTSFSVKGIELSLHGDYGASGSRGSINQFKNYPVKTITAHSHKPQLQLGAMSVGTLTRLDLPYMKGASSWMQSNAIIHDNGKRQILNIINGKYTTLS